MGSACNIEGCWRPRSAKGWCGLHYGRWKRTGDPERHLSKLKPDHLVRLRRMVGLPDDGPTPEMVAAWRAVENLAWSGDSR